MARVAGIVLLLLSFSYYVFAHGTCTTFDSDLIKCEILSNHAEPCSDAPHTDESGKPEASIHACGCVSVFVPAISQSAFTNFPKVNYRSLILDLLTSDFTQRIERPPIVQS